MTLQEKIQKKAEGYGKLATVFLEGAKFALENHQFISVDDDLPCNHKELLSNDSATNFVVAIVNFDIEIKFVIVRMYRNSNIWTWWTNGEVLYWFPIPEPPKG